MAGSRPDTYTKEIGDRLCGELVKGRTLRAVLNDEGMPCPVTLWRWRTRHAEFDAQITASRAAGMEYVIDETRDIVDDGSNDWMEKNGRDGVGWQVNGEAIQRSKLRVEQRFREAEALAPKVYGKRQAIEHSGAVGVLLVTASEEDLVAELLQLATTGRLKLPGGMQLEPEADITEGDEDDFTDIC